MGATLTMSDIRRTVAGACRRGQPWVRRAAAGLLRFPAFERALNAIERRFGQIVLYPRRDFRVSDAAAFLFHTNEVPVAFRWTCRIDGVCFVVPVERDVPHPPPRNDPWGYATYWQRDENRKIRQFYETYLRRFPSGTVLDVGANWGCHAYPFAAAGYECVCFEPQSICCSWIRRLREMNGFTNLTVVEAAIGSAYDPALPFFESEIEAFSSTKVEHVAAFHVPWSRQTVECLTLDAFCRDHRLSPTLMKIDTEGFEWDVVQGAAGIFRQFKPDLLVEVSSPLDSQRALWEFLAGQGYRCYSIVRSLGRPYPKRPFVPVRSAAEFIGAGQAGSDHWEGDNDFIFLQPGHDVLGPTASRR